MSTSTPELDTTPALAMELYVWLGPQSEGGVGSFCEGQTKLYDSRQVDFGSLFLVVLRPSTKEPFL